MALRPLKATGKQYDKMKVIKVKFRLRGSLEFARFDAATKRALSG